MQEFRCWGALGLQCHLFIANLSFSGAYPELLNQAKFGVLCGTIIAGILGYVVLNQVLPKKKKVLNKSMTYSLFLYIM